MAHHRLGHALQTRQALDQATQGMVRKYPVIGREKAPPPKYAWHDWSPDWHDWLRFDLVRDEAEQLVKGEAELPK
jgi:hypothetical protein